MLKKFLLLFILFCGIVFLFLPTFTKVQDKKRQNLEYQKQIQQLKIKNRALRKEKYLLEKDPVYLEKVAREKMGLVGEDEVVYRIIPTNAIE